MIFLVGSVNGSLRIYHNETNYASIGNKTPGAGGRRQGSVFDDEEDDSPRRVR